MTGRLEGEMLMLQERQIAKNNRADAEKLIEAVKGSIESPITFQVFDDAKRGRVKPEILHGTVADNWEYLCKLNGQGAGIYFTVNDTDGQGRREENIVALRAFWVDFDGSPLASLKDAPLKPHLLVETSPARFHSYWRINPVQINNGDRDQWKQIFATVQTALANLFGGDASVKDLPRVMRLAGTAHQKKDSFLSKVLAVDDRRAYDIEEFIQAFGISDTTAKSKISGTDSGEALATFSEGERNVQLNRYGCAKVAQGLSEDEIQACMVFFNLNHCEPPLDTSEVDDIFKSVLKYRKKYGLTGKEFKPDVYCRRIMDTWRVINVNGQHYRYNKGRGFYEQWQDIEVKALAMEWSNDSASVTQVENLVKRLEIKSHVSPEMVNPKGLISTKSGVIDPETGSIHPHSPDVIFTVQLPVECENPPRPENYREPNCPLFQTFLDRMLPEPFQQEALWEMMGYGMSTDNRYEKAFLLYGEGDNGKSVILNIMKALFQGYVSVLRLSELSHTFRPAALIDKLINISSEGESSALIDDPIVKTLISGEELMVERKYRDAFSFRPFAKIIVASNHLPRSRDKSHGYFRRWLMLHFMVTIPQKEKDTSLSEKIIESELDEIFYGALVGLQRLRRHNGFTVPLSSSALLQQYEEMLNPALVFFKECLKAVPAAHVKIGDLYSRYRDWCEINGHPHPLTRPNLRAEIEKHFPHVQYGKQPGGYYGFQGLIIGDRP
jgi:P4 family phage/plasmid primase-like protien